MQNDRIKKMKELEQEMLEQSGKIGLGCGTVYPKYIMLGQNPGCNLKDDRVFMRPEGIGSSQVLLPILDELKIWDDCYFDNVVKNTTEKNKTPTKEDVQRWMLFLIKELEILDYKNPEVKTIALGNFASNVLSDNNIKHIKISHPARCFHGYLQEEYRKEIKKALNL